MGEFCLRTLPTDDFDTITSRSSTFLLIYSNCGQKAFIALCPVDDVKKRINQMATTINISREKTKERTKRMNPHLQNISTKVISLVLSSYLTTFYRSYQESQYISMILCRKLMFYSGGRSLLVMSLPLKSFCILFIK